MDRILVALDTSPRAEHVFETATDLARRTGARLILYRAVSLPVELPAIALSRSPEEVEELLLGLAQQDLEELHAKLPAELKGGTMVSLATPWQGVCDAARLEHADLVVIGSHGYGGLDRLLGTTAAKVVDHATASVLVVKNG
jgi:universal stress protein F